MSLDIVKNWKVYSLYYSAFFSLLIVVIHILNFKSFAHDGVFLLFWPVAVYFWIEIFSLAKKKSHAEATDIHHIKSTIAQTDQLVNWDWDSLSDSNTKTK